MPILDATDFMPQPKEAADMSSITAFADEITGNPLDLIEQLVIAHEWPHDRQSDEDMAVEIAGKYCDYRLWFAWRPDIGALHLSVALDMKVQKAKRAQIIELLAALNERLWLGHFDLWSDERVPMFRYTMLVRGGGLTAGHVEEVVEIAVSECERYYPAFQFVIWGGKSAEEAVAASMLDTVGEA